jgi:hypothetical protein
LYVPLLTLRDEAAEVLDLADVVVDPVDEARFRVAASGSWSVGLASLARGAARGGIHPLLETFERSVLL